MKRVLLDTHALLWFLFRDARLPAMARGIIEDPGIRNVISVASLWEVTIKVQLGKLDLGLGVDAFFDAHIRGTDVDLLEIRLVHLSRYAALPMHHRDPFDRLLVAQAASTATPILTGDSAISAYEVETLWA